MTFTKICPSHNGYPGFYAYEYESYRDKESGKARQRMVRYLGPCDKDGKILRPPRARTEARPSTSASIGRLLIFHASAEKLHIRPIVRRVLEVDEETAGLFMAIVYNQASDRVPDDHLPGWVEARPVRRLLALRDKPLTPEIFGKVRSALCHLSDENDWEDRGRDLQTALTHAWKSRCREPPGAYYDVTKIEYHGWTNPYAEQGHDANGGISTVIGFGMVVSEGHHHPYLCRALPGSQNDALSVKDAVMLLRGWGYRGLRLVMDRGMISRGNVELATREGFHLVGLVKGWERATMGLASHWSEEELERLAYLVKTSRGSVYARAMTTSLFDIPKVKVAVVVNPRRKMEEREGRELALQEWNGKEPLSKERTEELKRQLKVQNPEVRKKKGWAPGLLRRSTGRRGAEVDDEAVRREKALDGRFLIFSTDLSLKGPEMYRTYFARDGIEKVFRTGKGELCLEPLRFHRQDRTDAYATVFYTASLLWSWTEQTLKRKYPEMSLAEALDHLETLSWMRSGSGKSAREWATKPTDQQKDILSALGATRYLRVV